MLAGIVSFCDIPMVAVYAADVETDISEQAQSVYEDFVYEVKDGEVVITSYTGSQQVLEIPESVEDTEVTAVGAGAFEGNGTLTQVTIPESVEKIEEAAFRNCGALQMVSVESSRSSAGLVSVASRAFEGCVSLSSVEFPRTIQEIGEAAFDGCVNLKDIFYNGTPEQWAKVTVGAQASGFTGPVWFYSYYRNHLLDLIAYRGSASEVKIPAELRGKMIWSVEKDAFTDCPQVTSIQLSKNVDYVAVAAFSGCPALEEILVEEGITRYASRDGVLVSGGGKTLYVYPQGRQGVYAIPDTIETIFQGAFAGCEGLTEVIIPDSVTKIQENAFAGCTGLTKVIYRGTQTQWEKVLVDEEGNEPMLNAELEASLPQEMTVRFEAFQTEEYEDMTVLEDSLVTEPATEPYRDGYVFLGWYLGDEKWDFSRDRVEGNMTLTARWMADEPVYWIFDIPYDQNDRKQGNRIVGTGDEFKLSVGTALATYPDRITNKNWESRNPEIVSNRTNNDMEVWCNANSPGTGDIVCSLTSILTGVQYDERVDSETFHIRVVDPATTVRLGESTKTMQTGETDILDVLTSPGDNWARTAAGFSLTSSAPEVVDITIDGCLQALTPGTAVITASLKNGASASCTITVYEEGAYVRGDANGDGEAGIDDLRLVLRHVCRKTVLEGTYFQAADVTDDGNVDIQDLRKILRFVCRKITEL